MMTQDIKEKTQLERIEDMIIEDILETSDEEILAEFAEEVSDVENEVAHMRNLVKDSVFKHNKAKFEAAKQARLSQKTAPQKEIKIISLARKKEIIKALNTNDNLMQKITMAARGENDLSEGDLNVYLKHLMELGVIDEEGNILCEDD